MEVSSEMLFIIGLLLLILEIRAKALKMMLKKIEKMVNKILVESLERTNLNPNVKVVEMPRGQMKKLKISNQ